MVEEDDDANASFCKGLEPVLFCLYNAILLWTTAGNRP